MMPDIQRHFLCSQENLGANLLRLHLIHQVGKLFGKDREYPETMQYNNSVSFKAILIYYNVGGFSNCANFFSENCIFQSDIFTYF